MIFRKAISACVLFLSLSLCNAVTAQTAPPVPAPPPDPLETGWNVSVNGGYSQVQNAGTNNGFFFSTGIRLSQHFVARGDVYVLNDPAVTISLAKPEARFSARHIFKSSSTPAVQNTEFFVNAGLGDAHYTDPAKGSQSKFAWGLGGGFDVKISDSISVRPLDVNYLRSSIIGGGKIIGNHLQFAATLGLRL